MLSWVSGFDTFLFLTNNGYALQGQGFETMLAAGVKTRSHQTDLESLQGFINCNKGKWLFGHLGYGLKNETEPGSYVAQDNKIGFENLFFFEPEVLVQFSTNRILITADNPHSVWIDINKAVLPPWQNSLSAAPKSRYSKEEYVEKIGFIRQQLLRGNCYEVNFCNEFYIDDCEIDPIQIYLQQCQIAPNPYSTLYKHNDSWLMCASPERFLKKQGSRIFSQPIKGTLKNTATNPLQLAEERQLLFESEKDRAENVMIVDLVRNDLSKICEKGSVAVDELFGIYTFPYVHQMVSTISGSLGNSTTFVEVLKALFPMGSMTGAPKKNALKLIDNVENVGRGLFSGSVGYINPDGDFDFNVVIRSIFYNQLSRYVSFMAGSGITYYSNALSEWDECLAKAIAFDKIFSNNAQ